MYYDNPRIAPESLGRRDRLPPQLPPKRRWGKVFLIVSVLFALSVAGCVALVGLTVTSAVDTATPDGSDFSGNTENPPIEDVEVTSCDIFSGIATPDLKITNNSSKTSDYTVTLSLTDADGVKVGDAHGSIQNVAAGQVAEIEAYGTGTDGATCTVEEVERFAS